MLKSPSHPGTPVLDLAPQSASRPAPHPAGAAYGRLSLRVNFSWTLVGNLVYAGCQWGMLMVLAKLGSPDVVGLFALALAVTAPVVMFANLQMRGVQASDARDEFRFGDYLSLRLLTSALALAVIAGLALTGYGVSEAAAVILVIGVAKAFESLSDILYGALQQRERMDRIAVSMMLKGVLSLAGLGVAVALTGSVLWGAAGLATSWLVVLLAYDVPMTAHMLSGTPGRHPLGPHWSPRVLVRLAWLGLPLGVVMCLISLNTNVPRYFIESYRGLHELGIFSPLGSFLAAGYMVVSSLGQSAVPRLARHYADGDRAAFRSLMAKLVAVGAVLGVGGLLVAAVGGRVLLTVLFRPEYAEHADVFCWLMAVGGLTYIASFQGYGMTAARYFRAQPVLFVLVCGATALGCWLLVPTHGLLGAAWAMLAAAAVQVIGGVVVLTHALRGGRDIDRVR